MTDKSFPITLVVLPMTPEDDYYIDVEPLGLDVEKGEIARFAIVLSGSYAGGINLEVKDAPSGAKIEFDVPNPVLVSDTITMLVDTSEMPHGRHEMFVHAIPVKDKAIADVTERIDVVAKSASSGAISEIAARSTEVAALASEVAILSDKVATEMDEIVQKSK